MTLSQKLLLGFGGLVAFLYLTSGSASAATGGGTAPSGGGTGGGGTGGTPNPGDQLLVVTSDTGPGGRLFVRSTPGVQAGTAVGVGNIVAIVNHGDTLVATGTSQTAADGSTWWGVTTVMGISGWSEKNYLQNQSVS